MDNQKMAYIARCRACEQIIGVTVDNVRDRTRIAAHAVFEWMIAGFAIERVTAEFVQVGEYKWCACHETNEEGPEDAIDVVKVTVAPGNPNHGWYAVETASAVQDIIECSIDEVIDGYDDSVAILIEKHSMSEAEFRALPEPC